VIGLIAVPYSKALYRSAKSCLGFKRQPACASRRQNKAPGEAPAEPGDTDGKIKRACEAGDRISSPQMSQRHGNQRRVLLSHKQCDTGDSCMTFCETSVACYAGWDCVLRWLPQARLRLARGYHSTACCAGWPNTSEQIFASLTRQKYPRGSQLWPRAIRVRAQRR
jgi:hypothetical protein